MRKLLGMLTTTVVYLCVATVITECLLAGYALTHGYLDKEKLTRMVEVAQGIDTDALGAPSADIIRPTEPSEQPSLEDIERRRAVQSRNLEKTGRRKTELRSG